MSDTMKNHIALIAASMQMGGAERMTLNLATEFARRGHAVDLVLIDRTGPLLKQIPPGVRVVGLGGSRARGVVGPLRRYLKRERPLAVLSIAFQTNILTMLATFGLRPKPRIILSVRSTYSAVMAANPLVTRTLFRLGTRLLYPRADRIVGISHGCSDDLRRHAGLARDQVLTIYNPVLADDFERLAAEPLDATQANDPAIPTVVMVGRLAVPKDQPTLIRAFAKVVEQRPARLVLVGEGERRPEFEALASELGIAESVTFAGLQRNPYPFMREAALFVLSSVWEGFGNVLVEAMAVGTPVISSDCRHGPREILENGRWGGLVPPGDPDALAEAMLEILHTGGIDARERARQFTVERAADKYLDVMLGQLPTATERDACSQAPPRS